LDTIDAALCCAQMVMVMLSSSLSRQAIGGPASIVVSRWRPGRTGRSVGAGRPMSLSASIAA